MYVNICAAEVYGEVEAYQAEEIIFTYLPPNLPA
jgi:hypothetical protein